MTPEEQRKLEEEQIRSNFSELQQELSGLQNEISDENKSETFSELTKQLNGLQEQINQISENTDLGILKNELTEIRQDLDKFKQSIRGEVGDLQEQIRESVDKQNEKISTPTTYELLKDSETCSRLLTIISDNPKKFEKVPGSTPEAKLEYIFSKIRKSLVLFLKNKLGKSERYDKIIDNTIAPAFEWTLMELLRDQGNEANVNMLKGMDKISRDNFNKLVSGVGDFAKKTKGSFDKFNQWMNAIDYLSVHNGVLQSPEKSEVLSNPIEFKNYLNDPVFAPKDEKGNGISFSPYEPISKNIFKVDENQNFEFGITPQEKQTIIDEIGHIQVVNNPKTTSLIVNMLDKPEKFFGATEGLQKTANGILDGVNSLNSVTKVFGMDILGEITKVPEKRSFLFRIMDFVCKLIGITGGLEGIVKKWRLDRMNLTDEKNENISQIFKDYQKLDGKGSDISITDASSCGSVLANFALSDLDKQSTTKGDHLRDVISSNIDINLISPAVVQQTLGDAFLKKEIISVNGQQQEKVSVDTSKFTAENKRELAHMHIENMTDHFTKNYDELREFYANIHNTDDLALCITASLYVDKDDVIEGVKAKVFLPENYGAVHLDGTVSNNNESGQSSGEVSKYKLSEGEYPFKDVPPYKGIATYDLRNVKITPVLDYSELTKQHEGTVTLNGSNITNKGYEYPSNKTTGNKNNNPCDISHSGSDIGYVSSGKVADGQALAKYDTPVNGIASAMRLLKNKYKNKSITEIDVGGYQGYYKANEEIGLSALRLKRITDQCNALGVGPHQMLDFNDPTTLKSFVAQVAVLETGTHIGQKLLDDAYAKAFA